MSLLTYNGLPLTFDDLGTYAVTESSGTLGSGQQYIAKVPDTGPGYVGVIYLHGGFQTETEVNSGNIDVITDVLAKRGFPVISGRVGGSLWGNDASRVLIDELKTKLVADLGADSYGKVVILGTSMGGWNGLSWISQHLSETACFVGLAPVSSGQAVYELGNPITSSIDTAYSSAWLAQAPTHDPTPLAEAGAFDGLNAKLWYSQTDGTIDPLDVENLATEIGGTVELVEVVGLHAAVPGLVEASRVLSYIAENYPPTFALRKLLIV